jgi:UDP-glucose:(glucosyl)LPS beta-1,3-glucosyltransferase
MDQVTFIIPSINRESITKTIDSLFKQTSNNWKAIIIYDGVRGKQFDDDRVKTIIINKTGIVGQIHGEAGLVRNVGIKEADTEWIAFLDDDDTINPNYVETLLSKYNNYDWVLWKMKYENGLVLPQNNQLIFGNVGISFAYKKDKFFDILFKQNRNGEDFDFVKELETKSQNYIITEEVYYNVNH